VCLAALVQGQHYDMRPAGQRVVPDHQQAKLLMGVPCLRPPPPPPLVTPRESEVSSREACAAGVVAAAEERRREAEAWEARTRKVRGGRGGGGRQEALGHRGAHGCCADRPHLWFVALGLPQHTLH